MQCHVTVFSTVMLSKATMNCNMAVKIHIFEELYLVEADREESKRKEGIMISEESKTRRSRKQDS